MTINIKETRDITPESIMPLYLENKWSSAKKPQELYNALINSHSLVTAWSGKKLVGLGNAISDGYLVVYYPHLLVLPEYQGKGVGKKIMAVLQEKYRQLHQQMLVADERAKEFYQKCGFTRTGNTESMWIYSGDDH